MIAVVNGQDPQGVAAMTGVVLALLGIVLVMYVLLWGRLVRDWWLRRDSIRAYRVQREDLARATGYRPPRRRRP